MAVINKSELEWQIVSDALTIPERLSLHRQVPSCFRPDPARAEKILSRLVELLNRDGPDDLGELLEHHGVDPEQLPVLLGSIDPAAAETYGRAPWIDVCEEVLAWDGELDENGIPTADYLSRDDEESIPFEHALVPWVDVATMRLRLRRPELDRDVPAEVLREEQRGLLESLATFSRDCNVTEFSKGRLNAYDANDMAMGMFMSEPPRDVYHQTIRGMTGEGMLESMKRYPALARLLGVRVESWARAMGELLDRIESDREMISESFNQGREIGGITKARFGRGDSHNGGRTVAILEFDSGLHLVYKPRSMTIDEATESIMETLNSFLDPECRLRVPRSLDRGLYGWVEYIEPRPCEDQEEIRLFYLRMGVLLGVVHLLQGNDFHLENVIACGSMPVAIDLETISVPSGLIEDDSFEEEIVDPARDLVMNSVLGTLLLPSAMAIGKQRDLRQLGALRVEVPGLASMRKIRKLTLVNTDFQRWVKSDDEDHERPNSEPWIEGGEATDARDFLEETKKGYRHFYEGARSHHQEIIECIAMLENAWVRVLNRATNVYFRLMLESCDSTLMRSGVDRWVHIQRLALTMQADSSEKGRKILAHLVDAESNSLFDGDIAYFTARGGSLDYAIVDPTTAEYLTLDGPILGKTAGKRVEEQLDRMSPEDLHYQMKFQGDAYMSTFKSLSRLLHGSGSAVEPTEDVSGSLPEESRDSIRQRVITGLENLYGRRIQKGEVVNWVGMDIDSVREVITPSSLLADLYAGRGGIALVFERAYRVFGDRRWLDVARSSMEIEIAGYRQYGEDSQIFNLSPDGMGVWAGLTSALWCIGRHEGMGECRDLALRMISTLDEKRIRRDEGFDFIAGSAGAILLLHGLNAEEPIPGVQEVIGNLSEHLVRNQCDDGGPGWASFTGDRPVCGIGHGRAGIALALMKSGQLLDRKDLLELGLAVCHAEHALRGATTDEGWPDLRGVRFGSQPESWGSKAWCNGLEGIALARAESLHILDDPILRDDLEFSLAGVNEASETPRHHLCCGKSGRITMLNTLRHLVPEADICDPMSLMNRVAPCIDTVDTESSFGLTGPGLMQGYAGALWMGLDLVDDQNRDVLLLRV